MQMKKILLVDRDTQFVKDVKANLEKRAVSCETATSAGEALEKVKSRPDMIFLEVMLEEPTAGFRVVNELRNPYKDGEYSDIPIWIVSQIEGLTGLGYSKVAGTRLLPCEGFVSKPVSPDSLLTGVERWADTRTTPGEKGNVREPARNMILLCLNCGSSSVKYQLYNWDGSTAMARGTVERVTQPNSVCIHEVPDRETITIRKDCPSHAEAIKLVVETLMHPDHGVIRTLSDITAVGHRVVHGGETFTKSVVITEEAIEIFNDLVELAPLHNPPNILGIRAAKELLPDVPHVAVMDTAWHQTMPEFAYIYALPYSWYEKYKIRRYGFHGTSLLYVSRRAAVLLGKDPFACNLILCHIGNGVSINAVCNGVSYDTSMGFTPLEGLVMGTRAGDHDAAIDLYVMQKEGADPDAMNSLLNKKSGILGITGKYIDRRDVLEAVERGEKRAKLALDIETYRIRKYIGAYAAALGRVDAIVFTAGVGEMGDSIRAGALDGLEFMGVRYDKRKNRIAKTRNGECDISAGDAGVRTLVIPTDEERVFIEDIVALFEKSKTGHNELAYHFQYPDYRNVLRRAAFEKECEKNAELSTVVARIASGG